ncbi:YgjV family protein [Glaciecola sp. MH2013]|uniref:YgjV family protein n=1 Tax=Glaciecola sp. MH2013 TaxID=2785524 RepID=UPI0018A0E733|nr:YgjV family protein [Glaciecola sp. MH2013]MBF7075007.1 YgjV family protein [Glaciecola sp. MH2013]
MPILAEAFGAVAVIFNFIGYRQTDINRYRLISAVALLSVSVHFFLLGNAYAAGIGCLLACIRNVVATRYTGLPVLFTFVGLNIAFFIFELIYLDSSGIIIIAYASSLIFTVGSISLKSATAIRQWFILAELLGLIFAVLVGSIFGTIFNITNLCSILFTLYQERRRKS